MSNFQKLNEEIAAKVDEIVKKGGPLFPDWIAHAICNDHADGLADGNEEADFWRHNGYRTVRRQVGTFITKNFKPEERKDERRQFIFPGFDHVQTHYVVERDGDEIAIPTNSLTDEEIDAVVSRMRSSAATLYAHADELERFKSYRAGLPLMKQGAAE